jgi:hypothetical protein
MNSYFFKMTKEEKENILDKHKSVYDGYVTQYIKPNQEPLYVQDFANDKNGITLSNKGNLTGYKNVAINEIDSKFAPNVTFETEVDETFMMSSGHSPLDKIADGEEDLVHGTMNEVCPKCGGEDPNCEFCGEQEFEYDYDDDETSLPVDFESVDLNFSDLDEQEVEPLKEQVTETLKMFNRINKVL